MKLHSIGHSTRSSDQLISLLKESQVDLLVDVRAYPRSRRNPQFNADVLSDALAAEAIGYRHLEALGGRRAAQKLTGGSPNGFWREPAIRNYADYALSPEFHEALESLLRMARDRRCAIMCAEADWRQCHRRIITDYLLATGAEIVHILGPNRREAARMTDGAEPQDDGRIRYPAAQGSLF